MKRAMIFLLAWLPGIALSAEVRLPGGTAIVLTTTSSINSDTSSVGEAVTAAVTTPDVNDGVTVIASGAQATGTVNRKEDSGMIGQSGKLTVEFTSVLAVDGTSVPIVATKTIEAKDEVAGTVVVSTLLCPLALLNEGDAAILPAGSQIRAISIGDVTING